MMRRLTSTTFSGIALASALTTAMPAAAQDNEWDFTGFIYIWGAELGGESATGQDIDISFSDILDNLDFAAMGTIEARKNNGPWSVFADAVYLNLGADSNASVGPGIPAETDVDMKGFVITSGVGYDLVDKPEYRLSGFGGVRYLNMDTTVNLSVGAGSRRIKDDFDQWDGIIGLRGQAALNEQWNLIYYGDIGTGDSDFTFQAALAAEYKFDKWSLVFGYRHLEHQGLDNSDTLEDLEFSGPFAGAKFKF